LKLDVAYYQGAERTDAAVLQKHAEADLKKGKSVFMHHHKHGELCNIGCIEYYPEGVTDGSEGSKAIPQDHGSDAG
jgi:hypothetical protein